MSSNRKGHNASGQPNSPSAGEMAKVNASVADAVKVAVGPGMSTVTYKDDETKTVITATYPDDLRDFAVGILNQGLVRAPQIIAAQKVLNELKEGAGSVQAEMHKLAQDTETRCNGNLRQARVTFNGICSAAESVFKIQWESNPENHGKTFSLARLVPQWGSAKGVYNRMWSTADGQKPISIHSVTPARVENGVPTGPDLPSFPTIGSIRTELAKRQRNPRNAENGKVLVGVATVSKGLERALKFGASILNVLTPDEQDTAADILESAFWDVSKLSDGAATAAKLARTSMTNAAPVEDQAKAQAMRGGSR